MLYEEAKQIMESSRKDTKNLKHMTTLRKVDTGYAIRYWNTDVVIIHEDNTYTLNSGGYLTQTTKDRINEYSPANIYQKNGLWFFANHALFTDNCRVDQYGNLLDPDISAAKTVAMKRKLDRMVSKYIKGFADMVLDTEVIPEPNSGDCWDCLFGASSLSHFINHFEENYYVPALLVNAFREYDSTGIVFSTFRYDLEHYREPRKVIVRVLSKYFRKRKAGLLRMLME